MKVSVLNTAGREVGTVTLPPTIFQARVNRDLMHQALVRQMANARWGTHGTKSRSEVSRTTAKWYRQKGTGRARHGSKRAPIFVGGGVTFGPNGRVYRKSMPRKMRRAALRSALSVKAGAGDVIVVNNVDVDEPKTRELANIIDRLTGNSSTLLLMAQGNATLEKAARNLPEVKTLRATYLNVHDLLGHHKIVIPLSALEVIQGFLGQGEIFDVSAGFDEFVATVDEEE